MMQRTRWWVCPALAVVALFGQALPGVNASSPQTYWAVGARLYTLSHGRWRPTTTVDSLGELRAVLSVHGSGLTPGHMTVGMALRHLSWQGFKKLLMPATVVMRMRRASSTPADATFEATVRVPTLLPVYWTVVHFDIANGPQRAEAEAGVMVGRPAYQTRMNTLTVPQTVTFCAARPRLRWLRYAVYLHGYFVATWTGGDGPPAGVILDRPRPVTPARFPLGGTAHQLPTGGVNLPRSNTWLTRPGFLSCSNGRPDSFGMDM